MFNKRLLSVVSVSLLMLIIFVTAHMNKNTPISTNSKLLRIHFIDVGQADSILIQTPNGMNMLIDAGNNDDYETVASYLEKQGVKKLDAVVGTHPHEDHIGGLDGIISNFDVGNVYLPKAANSTKTFHDVLRAIDAKGLKITQAKAGLTIELDPKVQIAALAPNSTFYEDLNNYSAVLKVTYGKTVFLFEGDAEEKSEFEMLARNKTSISADILKVGHHGSHTSTSKEFLNAVKPKYAVISVGTGNDYGHPHRETIAKLNAAGVKIFRTDKDGTIVVTSDGANINFNKKVPETPVISYKQLVDQPKKQTASAQDYIGNKNSHKFHYPNCPATSQIAPANKVHFQSREDGVNNGYKPCKQCNP